MRQRIPTRTWDPLPSSLENLSFREKSHDHDVDPLSRTVGPHAIKKPKSPSPIKKLAFTKEKWRWEEEAHAILSVWVEWKGRGSIGKEERRGDRIGRSGAINVARNSWRGGRSSRVRATPRMSVLPWSPWPTDLYYTRVQVPHIRVSTRNTDLCSSPVPWRVEQRARPLGPSRLSLLCSRTMHGPWTGSSLRVSTRRRRRPVDNRKEERSEGQRSRMRLDLNRGNTRRWRMRRWWAMIAKRGKLDASARSEWRCVLEKIGKERWKNGRAARIGNEEKSGEEHWVRDNWVTAAWIHDGGSDARCSSTR